MRLVSSDAREKHYREQVQDKAGSLAVDPWAKPCSWAEGLVWLSH